MQTKTVLIIAAISILSQGCQRRHPQRTETPGPTKAVEVTASETAMVPSPSPAPVRIVPTRQEIREIAEKGAELANEINRAYSAERYSEWLISKYRDAGEIALEAVRYQEERARLKAAKESFEKVCDELGRIQFAAKDATKYSLIFAKHELAGAVLLRAEFKALK